ncbi:voltage-gated potassium channel [Anaeromyces robustus]|uniref:Voltage-gated potassium channel n=1 Tax=Anaeromyces robustus TaxID=1754192 RepID=A0A1Y1XPJ5_9FUNG|nr:voltage-gated potassium channel [Anaeromyces robustus]|eukprot:ORX87244.1 voltage-gated potassium channel [Anaeromyces robustus]
MREHRRKRNIRKRIFEIIEVAEKGDLLSLIYDITMITTIVVSLFPLAFKKNYDPTVNQIETNEMDKQSNDNQAETNLLQKIFLIIDIVSACLFILDYVLRLITADYKLKNKSFMSFIKYPFTLWAIIDLISILPSITLIDDRLKMLRIFIMLRTLKIIRVFKTFRYSNSITIISDVIKSSKNALTAVCTLAFGYILVSALIIFNVEENTFDSFFMAVYWATVSLTTVGYGDIYPTTTLGRIIAMISSLCGIALVALPSGIITAGYLESLNERSKNKIRESSSVTLTADVPSEDITTIGRSDSYHAREI